MDRPNILIITTDQQRYDTIHEAGFRHMVTPNLDRLVREGCLYQNAYSPNPACLPARHNIITGMSSKYHGFDDNYFGKEAKCTPNHLPAFPQLLSDSGYDTVGIGKMHFQPCRRHNGFGKLELMEEIPHYLEDDEYAMYLKEQGLGDIQSIHGVRHLLYMLPQESLVPMKHHGSTWVADRSIKYLKERSGGRPFLLWSSFIAPHPPFDVPGEWSNLYHGKNLPGEKRSETPVSSLARENKNIADYPGTEYLRRVKELYFAAISFVDYNVGRILTQLEETGELDKTLIIFTSDHGEMLGDYGTYQKFLPYDSAAKIPFVVRYPEKIKAGTQERKFVDLNDILPTVLDVAGVSHPNPRMLSGESLFAGERTKNRSIQYLEHSHGSRRWVSVRNDGYKYNYYYGGGREELFDMKADPDETTNLLWKEGEVSDGVCRIKEELRRQLIREEEKQGAEGSVEGGDFKMFPDYQEKFYRENNPPVFPKHIRHGSPEAVFMDLEEEIRMAIRKETVVAVEDLDQDYYLESGTLKETV